MKKISWKDSSLWENLKDWFLARQNRFFLQFPVFFLAVSLCFSLPNRSVSLFISREGGLESLGAPTRECKAITLLSCMEKCAPLRIVWDDLEVLVRNAIICFICENTLSSTLCFVLLLDPCHIPEYNFKLFSEHLYFHNFLRYFHGLLMKKNTI